MITDLLIRALGYCVDGLLGAMLFLVPAPPSWASDGFDALGTVWGYTQSMDTWVPITFTVAVVLTIFTIYAVSTLIGVVRVVASYLTLGGGAT